MRLLLVAVSTAATAVPTSASAVTVVHAPTDDDVSLFAAVRPLLVRLVPTDVVVVVLVRCFVTFSWVHQCSNR